MQAMSAQDEADTARLLLYFNAVMRMKLIDAVFMSVNLVQIWTRKICYKLQHFVACLNLELSHVTD